MKNSKTAIRELTAKYRSILKKCAILNAICVLAVVGTANATTTTENIDFTYNNGAGAKSEKIYTITGSDVFPVVTDGPIVNIGTSEDTATVTNTGDVLLPGTTYTQLNVASGSSLTITGGLTNEAKTYVVGPYAYSIDPPVDEYNGPRYVQIYDKAGVPTRDVNAYSVNNFGTITATTEIRNKEVVINYEGGVITAPKVYNVFDVNGSGEPITMPTFENHGTVNGELWNSGKFSNFGTINGDVHNTGTLTSSLDSITGDIDNGLGILNTWGTLSKDLNGTVELQYTTQLNEDHSVDGILTNTGTFLVNADLTVNNAYSNFSNLGTLTIASTGVVISNISNTGVINNEGVIDGDVTNAANATLTTAMNKVEGTITNYGFLNTWGELAGTDAVYGGTVNLVDNSTITGYNVQMENVNLSSNLQVSTQMTVDNLVIAPQGRLIMKSESEIVGDVTNEGTIANSGQFSADIVNNGTFNNSSSGLISSTDFVNNGTLTADMNKISTLTTLTNNGVLNTSGSLDRDIGGIVNLVGSTGMTKDLTLETVNLSSSLNVANKNLTVTNLTTTSGSNINLTEEGSISGTVVNSGNISNGGTLKDGAIINNHVLSNSKMISSTVTNNRFFGNSATVTGDIINNSSSDGYFVNSGTVSGTLTNNGDARNNSVITGDITNNSFLYNNEGASISSDIVNNGSIQNEALITGSLANFGIVYNQPIASGMGIVDTEISNSGILINNGNVTNTVTDDDVANKSISNAHTIMNYGNIQAKNFTNAGTIHNLGIMGDNVSNDETIATTHSSITNMSNGKIYNNRLIKANTVVNNGIVENYDYLVAKTLTNNAKLRNEGYIGVYGNEIAVYNDGSLYNGGVIYGDVTNNAGAELTTTIFTVTGTLRNNGTLNTWGNLESVNGISLNGTTNLIYDSYLKQNATMNDVHVGDPADLSKNVTLDLETNKLTANSLTVADNSGVALRVKSKDVYGSVAASNYTVGTGTKLSFVLDRGILTEGNTITLPVFTDASGAVANLDFVLNYVTIVL